MQPYASVPPAVLRAMKCAAEDFNLSLPELLNGKSDTKVKARRRCIQTLRRMGFSLTEIGRFMGRHHTTVLHALGGHSPRLSPEEQLASIPCPDLSGEWAI